MTLQEAGWLFEAPLACALCLHEADLDHAYRRGNQAFRRLVARTIGSDPRHPFQFLVRQLANNKYGLTRHSHWQIDAGHLTPVATLKKLNARKERLAIQDRSQNRGKGAKRIQAVMVRGVPIDLDTLRYYVQRGWVNRSWLSRATPTKGWIYDGELAYVLGETSDWVRNIRRSPEPIYEAI